MNRQIDIKSFIIGILVTICIILVFGAARPLMSGSVGRFQIVLRDNHAYVLDSTDGRVWERYSPSSQGSNSKGFYIEKFSLEASD